MKEDIQKILDAFSGGRGEDAEKFCRAAVEPYQNAFMEALTVNTATDYIGVVVLYCQITAGMKKPWLAVPFLQAARGALRFIDDYMADRETVAATFVTFAESFAYAGFLPEAILHFSQAGAITKDSDLKREAFSQAFFYSCRFEDKPNRELIDKAKKELGKREADELLRTAKEDASSQIRTDPVERSEEYLRIRYDIEKSVDEALKSDTSNESFCLRYWRIKKHLLKDLYRIEWNSPAEMNPNIQFQ